MAVQIVAKETTCPKCLERLRYTTADVTKSSTSERASLHDDSSSHLIPIVVYYEIWKITCPSCGNTFQVFKYQTGSRKI